MYKTNDDELKMKMENREKKRADGNDDDDDDDNIYYGRPTKPTRLGRH